MKRLAVLLVAVVAVFGVAKADDDRVIETAQLPQAAQVFIKKYFVQQILSRNRFSRKSMNCSRARRFSRLSATAMAMS